MNTIAKFTITVAIALTASLGLSSCVNSTEPVIPTPPISEPSVSPTGTPIEVPEPLTVESAARVAEAVSGLTPERYAEVTEQATVIAVQATTMTFDDFKALTDQLSADAGKPVAIILHYTCADGREAFGITGALAGKSLGCGAGYEASLETALETVASRAERKGWTVADFVLVFAESV